MLTLVRAKLAKKISEILSSVSGLSGQEMPSESAIYSQLAIPKDILHGQLAYPLFQIAKIARVAPAELAAQVANTFSASLATDVSLKAWIESVKPAGGYLNFEFNDIYLQKLLFSQVSERGDQLGYTTKGQGQSVMIDYSSPNVAKPMHIGHLRATVIGQAIRNLAETQGYRVIGLNHLGDWGVQFGKIAWAFDQWKNEQGFDPDSFASLYGLYVRFHEEVELRPEIDAEASAYFKRLEEGDAYITSLWKKFVDISMLEYQKMWSLLGVRHDLVRGESFYNDRLKGVENLLDQKGLLVESEGAMVVSLGPDSPPCLIRKSDGASLYATRDLASAIYRMEEIRADLSLYVVGSEQALHFKQVFKVLELMGFEWAKKCHHISFGMYRFKDAGKMSSRKGNVIRLEDVLNQAIEQVLKRIDEKNPSLMHKEKIAKQVGIGAVVFNDLSFDRVKNVDFDWARVLDFEGDSGPYVQYCHVRCASLSRKYFDITGGKINLAQNDFQALSSLEERELVRTLLSFEETLTSAFHTYKPNILTQYLLDVCRVFNQFYQKNRIVGEAEEVARSRMALVEATRATIRLGLKALSIGAPELM
jgi:arginyl-tRNA synthetase